MEELNYIVEAVMFALGREISIEELAATLEVEENQVEQAMQYLKNVIVKKRE